ncbi:MAG: ribonuclease III [Clostridia bacterium]|nr:ribonuclease III [Clostridia bacterium]
MNLEEKIGYTFQNKNFLEIALTHTSYANEIKGKQNNERSEFLGDAVLELISSEYIFKTYPNLSEGEMTKTRAYCVCEDSLAEFANKYGFSDFLHVGKSEEKINGVYRNSIIADSVEAVIGAIFLDSGMEAAKNFILPHVIKKAEEFFKSGGKDYKTQLQEKLQIHGDVKIEYKIVREEGPEHNKTFVSEVYCNGKLLGQGKGKSKKEAEMEAAKKAL